VSSFAKVDNGQLDDDEWVNPPDDVYPPAYYGSNDGVVDGYGGNDGDHDDSDGDDGNSNGADEEERFESIDLEVMLSVD